MNPATDQLVSHAARLAEFGGYLLGMFLALVILAGVVYTVGTLVYWFREWRKGALS